jgi:hypothetical protein
MNKSQFQNPRLDLGLNAGQGTLLERGHPAYFSSSGVIAASPVGSWSGFVTPSGRVLGAKARMTSYEQLLVTEFGECGFEVMEEL